VIELTPVTFDDLVRMASRLELPKIEEDTATIAVGQIWQLTWDGTSEIGIVARADATSPTIVPLRVDLAAGHSGIYIPSFDAVASPQWRSARPVPAITLAGTISDTVVLPEPPSDITSIDDDVENRMLTLSEWLVNTEGTGDLAKHLKATGQTVSQLANELNAQRSTIIDLLRGNLVPDEGLTTRIASFLRLPLSMVQTGGAAVPAGLREVLARRSARGRVRAFAAAREVSDSQAWRTSAYGIVAMPYRTVGGRQDDAWESRMDRFFEVNG
jgi:transcriptional regulator with XRE-family HTH domain